MPLNLFMRFNWRSACGGGKCVVDGCFDIFELDYEERNFVVENEGEELQLNVWKKYYFCA